MYCVCVRCADASVLLYSEIRIAIGSHVRENYVMYGIIRCYLFENKITRVSGLLKSFPLCNAFYVRERSPYIIQYIIYIRIYRRVWSFPKRVRLRACRIRESENLFKTTYLYIYVLAACGIYPMMMIAED